MHTPMLTQMLAYEYMRRCDMQGNIEKAAALYRHKCETMLSCIEKYFPAEITHTTPNGGLFIWCDMGDGYDAAEVACAVPSKRWSLYRAVPLWWIWINPVRPSASTTRPCRTKK